ncbi:sensor domain-containing diguanylate cyclase [Exilibacterium tricleocarpae]|uniref:diguanylate cyclase n=1 Tax=Exilibacterium tricleocarpae TaxID=2591008 RepID=A0A545SS26_9GAMM|nr:sensor domain-containing diguanylate cyclase [Exilibacterium tricleocarpae]TQV67768.1 sensor domain-containing diguanylate cyclase [Exilibacterium tricleocarpae]
MMDLERENRRLQSTVNNLLARIEENHKIQQHYHDFEFQLLACTGLQELLQHLLVDARHYFELDAVSLVLLDRDYSLRDLLSKLEIPPFDNNLQLRNSEDFFNVMYPRPPAVKLGSLDVLAASRLFPGLDRLGSAACLPLVRRGRFIGGLHFGSLSSNRFSADKAADFVFHLASIVALCLENCIGREHLRRQGQVDMLTQVKNRRSFTLEFAKELERAERGGDPLTCMFVDIDHFKKINDNYGHQVGDLCLKRVAQAVHKQLRKTDLLTRYGGEEFVSVLPRCQAAQAEQIAERIRAAVAEMEVLTDDHRHISVTVSVGMSTWRPLGERAADLEHLGKQLLSQADKAMYAAKRDGRNRVCKLAFSQV